MGHKMKAMRPRIYGLENEYGLIFSPNGRVYLPMEKILGYIFEGLIPNSWPSNAFLVNGARFYQDTGCQFTSFYETFPNDDNKWNGSSDTAQDEPNWVVYQGSSDSNDIQINNEDSGSSPSGGSQLVFEDCDDGFENPEAYDIAYVSADLFGATEVIIEYYWQSDDVDSNEGLRVAYSTDSTDGRNGTWTQIAEYLNPSDDTWYKETFSLPEAAAVSNFKLRFSSKSSSSNEHMYVDDVRITRDN